MKMTERNGIKYVVHPEGDIPVIAEVDVVVAGGGPAGICAALGAARTGAKTFLIERNSCLGGVATSSLMANYNITAPHLVGAAGEIINRLAEIDGAWMGRVITFSPELMKQVTLEMLEEAGVQMLFYTLFSSPIADGNILKGIIIENKSGRQAILSKVSIDCTGDADIAYRLGVPVNIGRESDHKMSPLSLLFRMGNVNLDKIIDYCRENPDQFDLSPYINVLQKDIKVMRIEGFYDIITAARDRGEIDRNIHYLRLEGIDTENGTVIINSVRVYGLDGSNAQELTAGELESRHQMMQLISVLKKHVPGFEKAFLIDAAANLGVRETRRIVGEYVYTDKDAWYKNKLEDTVLHLWRRGSLGTKGHSPDAGEGLRSESHFEKAKTYDPNDIKLTTERDLYFPYRSLIPKEVEGLLVAGRCMSVDHLGDSWTRAIFICMACGQVAGVAAALSAGNKVGVREVDINEIRSELEKQGVDTGY